jgi:histone-binding protein RBBP4
LPKKRGRPKGSTRLVKEEKERERALEANTNSNGGGAKSRGGNSDKKAAVKDKFTQFNQIAPVIYDWFDSHNLLWPSLSCRWGPVVEDSKFKTQQRLYLSEQTDGKDPNTLMILNCEVIKPKVAAGDQIGRFSEDGRSPFVSKYKTLIHPGEVNRIRELPQNKNIIATHTDCPEVLIWDVESQPDRDPVLPAAESVPDLVLAGHEDNAEFALAMFSTEPYVLSGGKDKTVVLWSIHDHISTLSVEESKTIGSIVKHGDNPSIGPRGIFRGHDDTVEDVQFSPSSAQEFCSVGDDKCLILWDARVGLEPVIKVKKAHDGDVHCVDWNSLDENLILTGSADHSVNMFDRRNLTASGGTGLPVHKFEDHKAAVLCVQWSPDKSSVFGSAAEDGFLNIWDYEKVSKTLERETRSQSSPSGLIFKHAGHRHKVVDFHWNVYDPWTIVSVSDDVEDSSGGGTLQIWRMNDLIYRPDDEVLAELEQFKSHVIDCNSKPKE